MQARWTKAGRKRQALLAVDVETLKADPDIQALLHQVRILGEAPMSDAWLPRYIEYIEQFRDLVSRKTPMLAAWYGEYLHSFLNTQAAHAMGIEGPFPWDEKLEFLFPDNPIKCVGEHLYFIPPTTTRPQLLQLANHLVSLTPEKPKGPQKGSKQQKQRSSPLDPVQAALAYELAKPGVPKRLIVQRLFPTVNFQDQKAYDAARGRVKRLIDAGARAAHQRRS